MACAVSTLDSFLIELRESTIIGMITLLGCAFEGGGRVRGSRLGPAALRLAGIEKSLLDLNLAVRDAGDIAPGETHWPEDVGLNSFSRAIAYYRELKSSVADEIKAKRCPIVLGGDHSISIGSISGALECAGENLAVLWIDAHADTNTVKTSPSGFLHGMPLGFLTGGGDPKSGYVGAYWSTVKPQVIGRQVDEILKLSSNCPLAWNHLAWIALRDVDPGERDLINDHPECFASTMQDVDRFGIPKIVDDFDRWMNENGATELWISLDVDAFDPVLAPGTGTAVRGGLSYREGHLLAELLSEKLNDAECRYRLSGVDIVETNPIRDQRNETASIAVEWLSSLFGKTILGGV